MISRKWVHTVVSKLLHVLNSSKLLVIIELNGSNEVNLHWIQSEAAIFRQRRNIKVVLFLNMLLAKVKYSRRMEWLRDRSIFCQLLSVLPTSGYFVDIFVRSLQNVGLIRNFCTKTHYHSFCAKIWCIDSWERYFWQTK